MGSLISTRKLTPERRAEIQDFVEQIINNNKVAVFSKTYCPYCIMAKSTLKKRGIDYYSIDLDMKKDGANIQAYLLKKTGQRTVPNIFINRSHLGGCDDLLAAKKNGTLESIL